MYALANLKNPTYNYGYKGFTSIVTQFIDMAKMHVKMHQNYRFLVQDHQVLSFYDNVFTPENHEDSYNVGDVFLSKLFNGEIDSKFNAHTLADQDDLIERSQMLRSILRIKHDLQLKFEEKAEKLSIGKDTLGVQVRGTDKKVEISPPSVDRIIDHISKIICENRSIKKIYVATDDANYLFPIKEKFKDQVIFDIEKDISYDGNPLHYSGDRNKRNEQVLEDAYLLSKVDHFLYSFSNVSQLALIIGVDQHITRFNLNS